MVVVVIWQGIALLFTSQPGASQLQALNNLRGPLLHLPHYASYWGAQTWSQPSRYSLDSAEQVGIVTSPDPLAALILMQLILHNQSLKQKRLSKYTGLTCSCHIDWFTWSLPSFLLLYKHILISSSLMPKTQKFVLSFEVSCMLCILDTSNSYQTLFLVLLPAVIVY